MKQTTDSYESLMTCNDMIRPDMFSAVRYISRRCAMGLADKARGALIEPEGPDDPRHTRMSGCVLTTTEALLVVLHNHKLA